MPISTAAQPISPSSSSSSVTSAARPESRVDRSRESAEERIAISVGSLAARMEVAHNVAAGVQYRFASLPSRTFGGARACEATSSASIFY